MKKLRPAPRALHPTILLGLTTTPGSDWRGKVKEIDELNIKEIALFPTYLKKTERKELYQLLEKSSLEKIVFTHLREEDMSLDEINYIIERFKCRLFNIHPFIKIKNHVNKIRDNIYVENAGDINLLEKSAEKCAGLCVDFSHWEAGILEKKESYKGFEGLVKRFNIGLAHISAVLKKPEKLFWDNNNLHYSWHTLRELSELDYIKKYQNYLPEIIGLELENTFKEQLKAKEYISNLLAASS